MKTLLTVTVLLVLFITLPSSATSVYSCSAKLPTQLDFGILFATNASVWQKNCLVPNPSLYDPTKPTVIFVHGLAPAAVGGPLDGYFGHQEGFHELIAPWRQLGFNVALFNWTQFADEPLTNFIRAEDKIYDPHSYSQMQFAFLTDSGKVSVGDGPAIPVSRLLADAVIELKLSGPVWLVGHSLGSQLVTRAAVLLTDDGYEVQRVTLLDPVFSDVVKSYVQHRQQENHYCGHDLSETLGCELQFLQASGVATELYRSSFINRCIFSADDNTPIVQHAASTAVKLNGKGSQREGYCWNADLLSHPSLAKVDKLAQQLVYQHTHIVDWFIASKFSPTVPKICIPVSPTECRATKSPALSAAMSAKEVMRWSIRKDEGSRLCFVQWNDATATLNLSPSDDLFEVRKCDSFTT